MFLANKWNDFEIINAGNGQKLERWGKYVLLRPDPQAIWPLEKSVKPDAEYFRSDTGGGHWEYYAALPEQWNIKYFDLTFLVKPTDFKHTGLFPEQAANWDWIRKLLKQRMGSEVRVLNLFAYTGGATCAAAVEGASVTHVDAAKGMVQWAKENAALSGLKDAPIRYLVDDAQKFVARELRRGNKYECIIMDPPSYGRGPGGEMWKIERNLYELVAQAAGLLSDRPLFFLINSYTTGLAPTVLNNVLRLTLTEHGASKIEADEIALPITKAPGIYLPCGASGRAVFYQ